MCVLGVGGLPRKPLPRTQGPQQAPGPGQPLVHIGYPAVPKGLQPWTYLRAQGRSPLVSSVLVPWAPGPPAQWEVCTPQLSSTENPGLGTLCHTSVPPGTVCMPPLEWMLARLQAPLLLFLPPSRPPPPGSPCRTPGLGPGSPGSQDRNPSPSRVLRTSLSTPALPSPQNCLIRIWTPDKLTLVHSHIHCTTTGLTLLCLCLGPVAPQGNFSKPKGPRCAPLPARCPEGRCSRDGEEGWPKAEGCFLLGCWRCGQLGWQPLPSAAWQPQT